ncbi:MAG: tRNA dihydrouridine synthase DusB [bacterium]
MKSLMEIGQYTFKYPFFLAPMAGYTDLPFRLLCRKYGAVLAYTEMVSAAGLAREHKKTLLLLQSTPEDKPLAVQLFGSDPDTLAKSAKIAVKHGADIIDLNCGCAVKKVVKQGAGSALLKDHNLLLRIVSALVDSVSVPVTVKLRSGWDKPAEDLVELAIQLQTAGAKAVALHPRTALQAFTGNADWSLIAKLKQHITIPVIGSGDIKTASDTINMLHQTGCDAVMVARGALGQPWIFHEIIKLFDAQAELDIGVPTNKREIVSIMLYHLSDIISLYGERHGVQLFRAFAHHYIKGWKNAAKLRNQINQLNTLREIEALLERIG